MRQRFYEFLFWLCESLLRLAMYVNPKTVKDEKNLTVYNTVGESLIEKAIETDEGKETVVNRNSVEFIDEFKDSIYLKLIGFLKAYERNELDCIAAVVKFKRTEAMKKEKVGSYIDLFADWEDDQATTCVGAVKRLLTSVENDAFYDSTEDDDEEI